MEGTLEKSGNIINISTENSCWKVTMSEQTWVHSGIWMSVYRWTKPFYKVTIETDTVILSLDLTENPQLHSAPSPIKGATGRLSFARQTAIRLVLLRHMLMIFIIKNTKYSNMTAAYVSLLCDIIQLLSTTLKFAACFITLTLQLPAESYHSGSPSCQWPRPA